MRIYARPSLHSKRPFLVNDSRFVAFHETLQHKEGHLKVGILSVTYNILLKLLSQHSFRGDVKIPTYKPHTNHKKPSVSSHTLATTTICGLSHSVCGSPLIDLGHISSVTYVCHPLWFVCGHRKGILTSPLMRRVTTKFDSCSHQLAAEVGKSGN